MTRYVISTQLTPYYLIVSDDATFAHVYFQGKLLRDIVERLETVKDNIGGSVLDGVPSGFQNDSQWLEELCKRYRNLQDFYGWQQLPE